MQRNLEQDLGLSEEQALSAMQNPPFTVPKTFPSIGEASAFVNGYKEHHCKLTHKNSNLAGQQEKMVGSQGQPECGQEEEPVATVTGVLERLKVQPALFLVIALSLLSLLMIFYFWISSQSRDESHDSGDSSKRVVHIQRDVSAIVDVPADKPLKPAITKLETWIKKEKVQEDTRQIVSRVYMSRSDAILKRALKLSNSEKRPRKVEKFLLVAIAFNPKNSKAWKKLIEHYEHNGQLSKAASARQRSKRLGIRLN